MITFPKYESYQDSQVEWLGEIPSHWEIRPGFSVLQENKEKNIGMIERRVLSLSYGKIIVKPEEKLTGLVPESFETYQIVNPGDIIVRPTDLQNDKISLRTGIAKERGIITSAYICLRPNRNNNPSFVHYLLHSYDLLKIFYGLGSGLRQNLDYKDFKRLSVLIPPPDEQTRIAAFLDAKTTEIDEAIAKKQRLIELLHEQKAILINQAVTKGLNPSVPMRDSGVPWIGEIPSHWEVKKAKHVASFITSGPRGWAQYYSDSGSYFLQSGNLNDSVGIELAQANRVNPPNGSEGKRTRLQNNDVLICVTGANTGRVALAHIGDNEVYINQHLCLFRSNQKIHPSFLANYLHSEVGKKHFFLMQYGLKEGLSLDDVKNALILVPPVREQIDIAQQVENLLIEFDKAQTKIFAHIHSLNELKAVLLAEAVTGKIKI